MSEFARPSALAPFRIRNYRFQWPADLLTAWAFEMETLILGWYILVETGSVLLLTLFASLNFIGTLIAPMFGVVGDRIGHRDLLALMRATYGVLAATLMTLAFTGALNPVYVFVIVALMGLVRPSDLGVRGALVANIMPHHQLIGAISISRTTMDTARIAGALSGAGLFAALGMGPAYVAIVTLYIVSTLLTLCVIAPSKPHPVDEVASEAIRRSPMRDLKEGIAYVWTTPRMRAAIWIAFLANQPAYRAPGRRQPDRRDRIRRHRLALCGRRAAADAVYHAALARGVVACSCAGECEVTSSPDKECHVKDSFGGFGASGRFCLARGRRNRAAREKGFSCQDRMPCVRRTRGIAVCLEAARHDAGQCQGRPPGRGRARRGGARRRDRVLRCRRLSAPPQRGAYGSSDRHLSRTQPGFCAYAFARGSL